MPGPLGRALGWKFCAPLMGQELPSEKSLPGGAEGRGGGGGEGERSDCWRWVKAPSGGPPPPPHTSFSPNAPSLQSGLQAPRPRIPRWLHSSFLNLSPAPPHSRPAPPFLGQWKDSGGDPVFRNPFPSDLSRPPRPPLSPPAASHHPDPQPPGICPGRWWSIAWLALLEALTSSLNSLSPGWLFPLLTRTEATHAHACPTSHPLPTAGEAGFPWSSPGPQVRMPAAVLLLCSQASPTGPCPGDRDLADEDIQGDHTYELVLPPAGSISCPGPEPGRTTPRTHACICSTDVY